MPDSGTPFVTIFCTGQLMKFDMVVNALKEAGIAHQVRGETATGLKVAVAATPAQGPGTFFSVLVPATAETEARRILSTLPFEITANPGAWDFEPRPTAKRWLKVWIIGALVLYAIGVMTALIGLMK